MAAKDELTLDTGLIRKGEARGVDPARAVPQAAPPPAPAAPEPSPPISQEPPLRPIPPEDVPKRFTSFRLPVALDEELRGMIFETRRTKQDLLIEFVTAGVEKWRRERAGR
jgi:hypothetical protein